MTLKTPNELAASGSEHGHQRAFFAWVACAALHGPKIADLWASGEGIEAAKSAWPNQVQGWPELRYIHAIPNGGQRDRVTAGKLKAEGVKSGVPDIFVPITRPYLSGLYIEMKKPDQKPKSDTARGGVSDKQADFLTYANGQGYATAVCYSWGEAVQALKGYMGW